MLRVMLVSNIKNDLQTLKEHIAIEYPDSEVYMFTNASEALEFAQNNRVHVCFTDVVMDDMSGIALTKKLKELEYKMFINFMADTDAYVLDAWRLYVNDYLLKPITRENVVHAFYNVIRQPMFGDS